jgi:hypothetical protein
MSDTAIKFAAREMGFICQDTFAAINIDDAGTANICPCNQVWTLPFAYNHP